MTKKKFLLVTPGTFHYFDLAKALNKKKQLVKIITGYPKFKLTKFKLPNDLIISSGFFQIMIQFFNKVGMNLNNFFLSTIHIFGFNKIDNLALNYLHDSEVLLALSGCGLKSGNFFKENNKIYICERSSSHILFINEILKEEYAKYGIKFNIDKRIIKRELKEYKQSDFVLVPSKFAQNTFKKYNIFKTKVLTFPSNNKIFKSKNKKKIFFSSNKFKIIYVGSLSLRKGLPYLLDAFNRLNFKGKELHLVGLKTNDYRLFKHKIDFSKTILHGHLSQSKVNNLLNKSDVFVMPSLEEGAAIAVAQAMNTGLPVIVTKNTGWEEVVRKNNTGYVIDIKNSKMLYQKLNHLSKNKSILQKFSRNSLKYSKNKTWDNYVSQLNHLVNTV